MFINAYLVKYRAIQEESERTAVVVCGSVDTVSLALRAWVGRESGGWDHVEEITEIKLVAQESCISDHALEIFLRASAESAQGRP